MARYEMSDFEWKVIEPLLPQNSRGVPRFDDRRVLNGIFWVLRSGAPRADLPRRYGPHTTCYNRFRRWTKVGIWDLIMDAITEAYDGNVQMIDGTSVRVHHSAATLKKSHPDRLVGRSRGGLTTKIHAVTDENGLPLRIAITPGQAHDISIAHDLLDAVETGQMVLADKAYSATWLRQMVSETGTWANIPPKSNSKEPVVFSPYLYKNRNCVERFFNKLNTSCVS